MILKQSDLERLCSTASRIHEMLARASPTTDEKEQLFSLLGKAWGILANSPTEIEYQKKERANSEETKRLMADTGVQREARRYIKEAGQKSCSS